MNANEELLTAAYAAFSRGDLQAYLDMCADSMTWTVPGTTPFSGTHTKANFMAWIGGVMQICGGKFGETPVVIVANETKAVVVLDHWMERDDVRHEYRVDHIYDLEGGKFTHFEERPGSEAEFNRIWG